MTDSRPQGDRGLPFSLADLRRALGSRAPILLDAGPRTRAAVALVACEGEAGAEVLFIQRSEHDRDPWSGHLAFPGGRVEPGDPGPKEAAVRETREELGLDLADAEPLGRLDDLPAAHLPVLVSCFVFALGGRPPLSPNPAEVRHAFWFPLGDLLDPGRRREKTYLFAGREARYPAIRLLDGRPLLWGITYRLVAQLVALLGGPA